MSPRMMAGVDTGRILDSSGSMAGMMLRRISWGSSCRGRAPSSSPLVASLFFATVSWVLHESEVGIVDWHTSIPLRNTFHGDLILIVATSNVFSALQRETRWKPGRASMIMTTPPWLLASTTTRSTSLCALPFHMPDACHRCCIALWPGWVHPPCVRHIYEPSSLRMSAPQPVHAR